METPETRYAKSGSVHIAYQAFGEGDRAIVLVPGFVSHIENYWSSPQFARWLKRLGQGCKVVMFDKRGTGLSDHVNELPTMDMRMDDARAVMDAEGIEKAALLGVSEGGSLAALFAAMHPERTTALLLYGAFAHFKDWIPTDELFEGFMHYVDTAWGSGESLPYFAPSYVEDEAVKRWWGRFERLGASPSAAMTLMRMNREIDISHVLPTIQAPTLVIHRTDDPTINIHGGRELARLIPGARLIELPGENHLGFLGENADQIVDEFHQFLTGSKPVEVIERTLSTVLFSDIVNSTRHLSEMGDSRWREVISAHDGIIDAALARFRGKAVKSLGDGILATFDGPGRALQCAVEINRAVRSLGIDVRVGVHTGEVEMTEEDVRGIAVHIASRIMETAGDGGVRASRTVKDLVAGSGIRFDSLGEVNLAGLDEPMEVFAAQA
ncbi:adenylate/guanylate cyclase domain-containing protein [Limibacillus halophilus]